VTVPEERHVSGEYAARGDYHRQPNPDWDYYPTYVLKLAFVRRYLSELPPTTRVLDAGCGEGVLVEEFQNRLRIEGIDEHYGSATVRRGSITALPYGERTFDRILCLDVLEHLAYPEQRRALLELHRVLADAGELLVSVPNLAHLQSRINFLLFGRLIRTASEVKHPGDRPIGEYLKMAESAGFEIAERVGIFPTLPLVTHWIRQRPAERAWAHRWLTRLAPIPDWCFLNILRLRPRGPA